ncbi:GCN5-related N-acetyltransferase [Chthoniobacter flavus Ellin428]|uniref:GCN5-related N-acetyltransferase n=1 Tax=Chthoniobacter flavus Ellin428 TaxID=497964 RepID=B4D877_9BACT|nr:GNAT family N-acetyltransferase [Chthoniobacter flavus]EDY17431.1 GCN5-related N-acetyltransferase [Chthoniobacter flavus Ellin428]TCO87323.1 GNAT acetyltransferase-like protein [Chthoniobacter flavus]
MLDDSAISIATHYWTNHLGCAAGELFSEPLRIITHGPDLADYHGVFALFREGAAIVSLPPQHADALRPLLAGLAKDCSPDALATALQSAAAVVVGPAYIGYATKVALPEHPVRALNPEDIPALHEFQQKCNPTEWEHGGSGTENSCSGVFVDGKLVAVAGYEIWGGKIAHVLIITHPDHRGNGFARSAVAHLAARAIDAGLLPQYRTLESNRASIRIAETLGFHPYARSLAVRLSTNV